MREKFNIYFSVIFGWYRKNFHFGTKTGHQFIILTRFQIFLIFPYFLRHFSAAERAAFAKNLRSSHSEVYYRIAVLKISQVSRKLSVVGCFCYVKIKKIYTLTDVFLRNFSNFSEKPFSQATASVERKTFQKQLSGGIF